MPDLVTFLRARLDEDERAARYALSHDAELADRLRSTGEQVAGLYGDPEPPEDDVSPADRMWWLAKDAADWIDKNGPARVLAEVEAKRRMLGRINSHAAVMGADEVHGDLLCLLAVPYADHPDYQQAWKP